MLGKYEFQFQWTVNKGWVAPSFKKLAKAYKAAILYHVRIAMLLLLLFVAVANVAFR